MPSGDQDRNRSRDQSTDQSRDQSTDHSTDQAKLTKRADLAIWQAADLWRVLIRSVLLIQAGLLIACLAVPLLGADEDPPRSGSSRPDDDSLQRLTLLRGLLYYLNGTDRDFGDTESRPYGISGGRNLTIACLVALLVLVVLAVIATVALAGDSTSRVLSVLTVVAGVGLIVAALLLGLAQKWLDNKEFATVWQPGWWLPIAAGVWLLSAARARRGWDEVQAPG